MNDLPYPATDQLITGIAIADGNVSVLTGKILVARPHGLAVEFEHDPEGSSPSRGHKITLMYPWEDYILRLRTSVEDVVDVNRYLLTPVAEVSKGERREFLRADVSVRLFVDQVDDPAAAVSSTYSADETRHWPEQVVDLSGGGIRFTTDVTCKKGDQLLIALALEETNDTTLVAAGNVVRAKPTDAPGILDVALAFPALDESTRDLLVNQVFRRYYQDLGTKIGHPVEME
jgi:hypothetical protein